MICHELDRMCDLGRIDEVIRLHANAFNWIPQGRIPLGIHIVDPEFGRGLSYNDWLNPEPFFDVQRKILLDTIAVGSDLIPHVAINHLGHSVVTSLFGAEMFVPEETGATLQDVGPTPLAVFTGIEETIDLKVPSMDAGIMPEVRRILNYYRERLPDWVRLRTPMPIGPFSCALELRGATMLEEMVDKPELCERFIRLCGNTMVEIERNLRGVTGESIHSHLSNFGIMGTGLRLGEDSIVNLSPTMINEFCGPVFREINELTCGSGYVHFCSLPHSRFEHIYGSLAGMPEVSVVSSQFGFEYYETHLAELRGQLAVESFYGDAYMYVTERYGSFADWAKDFVPRFKNESGLVLYCTVKSLDEGREVWQAWQCAHKV